MKMCGIDGCDNPREYSVTWVFSSPELEARNEKNFGMCELHRWTYMTVMSSRDSGVDYSEKVLDIVSPS